MISHVPPEMCGMHLSAQDHRQLLLTGCFSSRLPRNLHCDLKGLAKRDSALDSLIAWALLAND